MNEILMNLIQNLSLNQSKLKLKLKSKMKIDPNFSMADTTHIESRT